MHLKLLVQDLFSYRSNLIDLDHGLSKSSLFLPFIETVSHLGRYEVPKHDFLLFLYNFISVDLPSQMAVILQKLAPVDFYQDISYASR